jgi:hypothetical protein
MAKSKILPKSDQAKFQSKHHTVADKSKFRKDDNKSMEYAQANATSDKLVALKAYRRANNLCFTYGEKWTGRNHKCPTQVPLHVIQELLEAIQVDQDLDYTSSDEDSEI